jgi:Kdo2-lipid IVA lauroyltransferase/acyltransferase
MASHLSNHTDNKVSSRRRLRRLRSVFIAWLGGVLLRVLTLAVRLLTPNSANRLGSFLGRLFFAATRYRRKLATTNVSIALGLDEQAARQIVRGCYDNMGKCLVEFIRMPMLAKKGQIKQVVKLEGEEHLQAALAKGKGVVLLTAHYGNWELTGARIAADYPLSVLARHQNDRSATQLVDGIREATGMRVISAQKDDITRVLNCLRRNEIVGFLIDQNAGTDGIFVDFFGRPASTHGGAAFFALRTGAAVVPIFGLRDAEAAPLVRILPEIEVEHTGSLRKDMAINTAKFTKAIEDQIRARPEIWFWLHNRWKTPPPVQVQADTDLAADNNS